MVSERSEATKLAEKGANSVRYGFLMIGVLVGMIFMSVLLRLLP